MESCFRPFLEVRRTTQPTENTAEATENLILVDAEISASDSGQYHLADTGRVWDFRGVAQESLVFEEVRVGGRYAEEVNSADLAQMLRL